LIGPSAPVEEAGLSLARRTSRRGFLSRVGRSVVALAGGGFVAAAFAGGRAEAYHFCGHTYTTGSCPHPYGALARTDRYGYPVHPTTGFPVDDSGDLYTDPATQTRRKICEEIVPERYGFVHHPHYSGGWTRCCSGRLRHIQDCCSPSRIRINGDASLRGYCAPKLRVFCVTFRELTVTC
jgi:hypothetical protein